MTEKEKVDELAKKLRPEIEKDVEPIKEMISKLIKKHPEICDVFYGYALTIENEKAISIPVIRIGVGKDSPETGYFMV